LGAELPHYLEPGVTGELQQTSSRGRSVLGFRSEPTFRTCNGQKQNGTEPWCGLDGFAHGAKGLGRCRQDFVDVSRRCFRRAGSRFRSTLLVRMPVSPRGYLGLAGMVSRSKIRPGVENMPR
jgi:hypothetical protein